MISMMVVVVESVGAVTVVVMVVLTGKSVLGVVEVMRVL